MLDFSGSTIVYLACGCTGLRKSYTGLAVIIKLKFHLDPYSRCMFAFCNRRRTLIKILEEKTKELDWSFAKSICGAQASATVYSITETALLNGLKPYNYLSYVMEKMKDLGAFPSKEAVLELLPWSSSLPDSCRSKLKK